jgi:hypothetical protein
MIFRQHMVYSEPLNCDVILTYKSYMNNGLKLF